MVCVCSVCDVCVCSVCDVCVMCVMCVCSVCGVCVACVCDVCVCSVCDVCMCQYGNCVMNHLVVFLVTGQCFANRMPWDRWTGAPFCSLCIF